MKIEEIVKKEQRDLRRTAELYQVSIEECCMC